ncbi:hypothetical protein BU26DRAFT_592872 [Trematosphaeria pertusa]|uniref:Uncharacterized protein n=1 Tax=Trematosphaeria pertusa TaxID=390896 RepID=A0A6A6IG92_9PLEO|nr:uncharacterized protein BU26DRAFT_592872 [Trematosphaeria pertusa]KAF2249604.1 hypothetical protein BU26DRAFT_592872 [Trematosphaeria pertusa]
MEPQAIRTDVQILPTTRRIVIGKRMRTCPRHAAFDRRADVVFGGDLRLPDGGDETETVSAVVVHHNGSLPKTLKWSPQALPQTPPAPQLLSTPGKSAVTKTFEVRGSWTSYRRTWCVPTLSYGLRMPDPSSPRRAAGVDRFSEEFLKLVKRSRDDFPFMALPRPIILSFGLWASRVRQIASLIVVRRDLLASRASYQGLLEFKRVVVQNQTAPFS